MGSHFSSSVCVRVCVWWRDFRGLHNEQAHCNRGLWAMGQRSVWLKNHCVITHADTHTHTEAEVDVGVRHGESSCTTSNLHVNDSWYGRNSGVLLRRAAAWRNVGGVSGSEGWRSGSCTCPAWLRCLIAEGLRWISRGRWWERRTGRPLSARTWQIPQLWKWCTKKTN